MSEPESSQQDAAAPTSTSDTAVLTTAPPNGMRTFLQVLVNTAVANLTTS